MNPSNKPSTRNVKKQVLLISEVHLPADGRAIRIASTFKEAGYHVIGAGFEAGARTPPTAKHSFDQLITIASPLDNIFRRYAVRTSFVLGTILRPLAKYSFWLIPHQWPFLRAIEKEIKASEGTPDIIIAKYWTATPLGLLLAKKYGAKFIYDANELSFSERAQSWKWRTFIRPVVEMIEREMFVTADLSTTIGAAVSQAFAQKYNLVNPPLPIRNIPVDQAIAPNKPNKVLEFIYVGHSDPSRHLDKLVRSTRSWKNDRKLVLQLTGRSDHIETLKKLAIEYGVNDRIEFKPAVPQEELIKSISASDLGLCLFPLHSPQYDLAEPNKIHQYLKAGLPIAASQMSALSELMTHYICGITGETDTDLHVAELINSVDRKQIRLMQKGVAHAQRELSWDNEKEKLMKAVADMMN